MSTWIFTILASYVLATVENQDCAIQAHDLPHSLAVDTLVEDDHAIQTCFLQQQLSVDMFAPLGVSKYGAHSVTMRLSNSSDGGDTDRGEQELLVFIGVNSAPSNAARRADVRASWMQDSAVNKAGLVQARFIVGRPVGVDASNVTLALHEEQALHGDFIWLPVDDTYDTLTRKTLAFLQWFASSAGPRSRFLMKLDDDTFLHVGPLMMQLQAQAARTNYSYLGYFHMCATVRRSGKNSESQAQFPEKVFPTYASGSGYVLSAALARDLVEADIERPMLHNEDASVGVWVDIEKETEPVAFTPIPATLYGCSPSDTISMNLETGHMACMWNKYMRGLSDICCSGAGANLALLEGSDQILQCEEVGMKQNSTFPLHAASSGNLSHVSENATPSLYRSRIGTNRTEIRVMAQSAQTTCSACAASGQVWCTGQSNDFFGSCGALRSEAQCFNDVGSCPTLRVPAAPAQSPPSFFVSDTHPDGRPEWDNTPLISMEHKFIFCEIPKVACTDFKRLFRRIEGANDYESQAPWVHDPKRNGIMRLNDLSQDQAREALRDPTWTKAVFIRDPLERLLSGFLDKCRSPASSRYDIHCPFTGEVAFGTFMRHIFSQAETDPHGTMSMDEHWRPQHQVCDLQRWLPFYQFQGNFSHLQTHTKSLLQGLGLFDRFGRGWGSEGADDIFEIKTAWHHTDTSSKVLNYFTRELADLALSFYRRDYELFSLPTPAWYHELV